MQPNDPDALWDQALLFKDQGQPAKVSDLLPPGVSSPSPLNGPTTPHRQSRVSSAFSYFHPTI
jgi:hypothetical protein